MPMIFNLITSDKNHYQNVLTNDLLLAILNTRRKKEGSKKHALLFQFPGRLIPASFHRKEKVEVNALPDTGNSAKFLGDSMTGIFHRPEGATPPLFIAGTSKCLTLI